MANNNTNEKTDSTGADIPNADICRICLEPIRNRSLTDTCNHQFCLQCLRSWSERHHICPFCRRVFNNILANFRSETEFELIPLPRQPEAEEPIQPDMVAITNLINQLRDVQQYNLFQEQHFLNLNQSLNTIDSNSMQYIQTLQMIANTEDRIDNNRQLIAQLRNDLRNTILARPLDQQNNAGANEQQGQNQNPNNPGDPPPN